jgi:hypothetical protein
VTQYVAGYTQAMTELGVALISEAIGSRLLLDLDDEGGSGQPVHAATMSLEGEDKDTVLADVEAILNRLQVTRITYSQPPLCFSSMCISCSLDE